jgi:hypothetical protein
MGHVDDRASSGEDVVLDAVVFEIRGDVHVGPSSGRNGQQRIT